MCPFGVFVIGVSSLPLYSVTMVPLKVTLMLLRRSSGCTQGRSKEKIIGWAHTRRLRAQESIWRITHNSIVARAAMSLSGNIIGRAGALPAIPLATPMQLD